MRLAWRRKLGPQPGYVGRFSITGVLVTVIAGSLSSGVTEQWGGGGQSAVWGSGVYRGQMNSP